MIRVMAAAQVGTTNNGGLAMDGFMVLFMGDCDDIPVAVLGDRDAAVELANEIGEAEASGDRHHERVEGALRVMGRDMGTFVGVAVATFEGGVMTAYDLVYGGDIDD